MTSHSEGFYLLDKTSSLNDCVIGYTPYTCNHKIIYFPLVLNGIFLILSFYFFNNLILNKGKNLDSTSGSVLHFWFGVILSFSLYISLQLIPAFFEGRINVRDMLLIMHTAASNVPYNSVTHQTSKIMKLFSIPGDKMFTFISYFISAVSYIILIIGVLLLSFYNSQIVFSAKKYISPIATYSLILSKLIFLFCSTCAFIFSKKTHKSTTKTFRNGISLLILIAAFFVSVNYFISYFVMNDQSVSLVVWLLMDVENREMSFYLIDLIGNYISSIIPVIAISIFMYAIMNIKDEDKESDDDQNTATVLKGLI